MTTTHRPSFASRTIRNAFWNVSLDGEMCLDDQPSTYPPDWVIAASAEHDRDGSHPDCVICQNSTGATLAAMNRRLFIISETLLNQQDLTKEETESLFEEQAELLNRIARAEDDAADDFADMRRENAYGKGL